MRLQLAGLVKSNIKKNKLTIDDDWSKYMQATIKQC